MKEKLGNIGILTSGGDAPGMNAALRAAVFAAKSRNMRLFGVRRGYQGLYDGAFQELTMQEVERIHTLGGTILHTARFQPFHHPEERPAAIARCLEQCRAQNIEGLIVIGGDGSFRGARDLSVAGLPCVCLPGTIDNDISCTDVTIGYDTALNTVMRMADAIADTAQSHERCMVLEVMGNTAGDLTLYGGISAGATAVLLMESGGISYPEEGVLTPSQILELEAAAVSRVRAAQRIGKTWFLILVSEGITGKKDKQGNTRYPGGVARLAEVIAQETGVESRCDVLAYRQRGGSPTARDRILAAQMGDYALEILAQGKSNRVIIQRAGKLLDLEIGEALAVPKCLSEGDIALSGRGSL